MPTPMLSDSPLKWWTRFSLSSLSSLNFHLSSLTQPVTFFYTCQIYVLHSPLHFKALKTVCLPTSNGPRLRLHALPHSTYNSSLMKHSIFQKSNLYSWYFYHSYPSYVWQNTGSNDKVKTIIRNKWTKRDRFIKLAGA